MRELAPGHRAPETSRALYAALARGGGWLCLVLVAVPGRCDETSASGLLESRGLVRSGALWLLPEERQLQTSLAAWRNLDKVHRAASQRWSQALADWAQLQATWGELAGRLESLTRLLADNSLSVKEYNQVVRELNLVKEQRAQLRPLLENPQGKLDHAPLRAAGRALIDARLAIGQAWLQVTRAGPALPAAYERLAADAPIAGALAELGASARLGPARHYDRDVQRLARAEHAIFPPGNVLVREEGQLRLGALVNERQGLLVAYVPDDDFTLLPQAELELAGADLRGARDAKVRIGADREVSAKVLTLDSLRIGPVLIERPEVVVVSDQGRDLGARLGRRLLADYEVEVDLELVELRLRRRASGSAAPRPPAGQ